VQVSAALRNGIQISSLGLQVPASYQPHVLPFSTMLTKLKLLSSLLMPSLFYRPQLKCHLFKDTFSDNPMETDYSIAILYHNHLSFFDNTCYSL
jgi:hypothetical protein